MKQLSEEAVEQIQGRRPIIAGAARFNFDEENGPYCFWSGVGEIELDGSTFQGIGNKGLITPISSRVGGSAESLSLHLSGLDPDIAAMIETEQYHQKPVTIWRLVFAPDGFTLLGLMTFMRGRVDFVVINETVGGDAEIEVVVEGPRRDMNRSGGRVLSNADQRVLGGAGDASAKHMSYAGKKTMNWGFRPEPLAAIWGPGTMGGSTYSTFG